VTDTRMQLHYAPGTIALVSLITLEEAGADYTPVRLDFAAGEQRSGDYLNVNPKGRVPALAAESGVLTETPAILTWIAATHPQAALMPADPFAAARVQELMAYLCSTVHPSHAHRTRGSRWSDDPAVIEALKIKVPQNMADHFTYLENRFAGPWAMGPDYSVADPYLFVLAGWLGNDGVDITGFPKIAGHQARMLSRPAVQRAIALESAP
jgi:glutathione S-transferase